MSADNRSVLVLFVFLLLTTGCCKKRVYCDSGSLKIAFAGFPRNEVRLLMLKRFKIGNDSLALDSVTLSYSGNAPVVVNKKDTLWLSDYTANASGDNRITWGNNWQIRFISSNPRQYDITGIGEEGRRFQLNKCDDNTTRCTNELTYFKVNGYSVDGNTIYIQR